MEHDNSDPVALGDPISEDQMKEDFEDEELERDAGSDPSEAVAEQGGTTISASPSSFQLPRRLRKNRQSGPSRAVNLESRLLGAETMRKNITSTRSEKALLSNKRAREVAEMHKEEQQRNAEQLRQNIENRLIEASERKQSLIQEKIDNIGSHNQHVAQVAQHDRELKRIRTEKQREQLEERLKQAAERREHVIDIQKQHRTASLLSSSPKQHRADAGKLPQPKSSYDLLSYRLLPVAISPEEGASRLQRFWRQRAIEREDQRRGRLAVEDFEKHGLTLANLRKPTSRFEQILPILQDKDVVHSARVLLDFIETKLPSLKNYQSSPRKASPAKRTSSSPGLNVLSSSPPGPMLHPSARSPSRSPGRSPSAQYQIPARVFLSAFMMVIEDRPGILHAPLGDLERDLQRHSVEMIERFERLSEFIRSREFGSPSGGTFKMHLRKFEQAWRIYSRLFSAWKTSDSKELVSELVATFLRLHEAKKNMSYREMLLRRDEQARAASIEKNDAVPNAAPSASPIQQWNDGFDQQMRNLEEKIKQLGGDAAMDALHAELVNLDLRIDEKFRQHEEEQAQARETQQQQEHMNSAFAKLSSSTVQSLYLAHEMALNPQFAISDSQDELLSRIKQQAERALWDVFTEELRQQPPNLSRVGALLEEIRDTLISFTPHRQDLINDLKEKIDLQFLRFDEHANVDVKAMLLYIVNKIIKLEAPERNIETQVWIEGTLQQLNTANEAPNLAEVLPRAFKFVFDKLQQIRLDIINFQLNIIRPLMGGVHGTEFERKQIARLVQSGALTLNRTSAWLQHNIELGHIPSTPQLENDHIRMSVLSLIQSATTTLDAAADTFPESLRLDIERLVQLQNDMQKATLSALCLLLLQQFLGRQALQPNEPETQQFLQQLTIMLDSQGVRLPDIVSLLVASVSSVLVARARPPLTPEGDDQRLLEGMIQSNVDLNSPLFKVLSQRLAGLVGSNLRAVQGSNGQAQASLELNTFVNLADQVNSITGRIAKLADHNLAVYGPIYQELINKLLKSRSTAVSSSSSSVSEMM